MKTSAHALFAAAFLISFPLSAANLLTNPKFDTNLNGWTVSNASILTATWTSFDATFSATSGSVSLKNTFAIANGAGPGLEQCVAITPGTYDLGARLHIPGNQANSGSAGPIIFFFSGSSCSGDILSSGGTIRLSSPSGSFIATAGRNIVAPAGTLSAKIFLQIVKDQPGGSLIVDFDDVFFGPTGGCVPDQIGLCVANGRFRVEAGFETPTGSTGVGQAIQLTADSGYFWFFNPENAEMIVKVLNGCGINTQYWVFSGGLTNVRVVLTVTDTVAGQTKTYTNPQGNAFQPIQDTGAFATCP